MRVSCSGMHGISELFCTLRLPRRAHRFFVPALNYGLGRFYLYSEAKHERSGLYEARPFPGGKGRRIRRPQPHGGCGDREGREGHRPGVSREFRRSARRAKRPGRLLRAARRGDDVRHSGALLPLGQNAPLHRRHSGLRRRQGGRRRGRPQSPGGRAGARRFCGTTASR